VRQAHSRVDVPIRVDTECGKRRIQLRLGEIREGIDEVRQAGECKRLGKLVLRPVGRPRRLPALLVDTPGITRNESNDGEQCRKTPVVRLGSTRVADLRLVPSSLSGNGGVQCSCVACLVGRRDVMIC
jgi:hypothetical protein